MEFLYFFGDRVEILEDEVGGGSGEVTQKHPGQGTGLVGVLEI